MNSQNNANNSAITRRSFLKTAGAASAAAGFAASGLMGNAAVAVGQTTGPQTNTFNNTVTQGDRAILRFLAAAELVEDDLWQQYCELAVFNEDFNDALMRIDPSIVRYICDDRDDERSHANLINAFLQSIGEQPVNLDAFRTLPSSPAQGAEQRGRLTSLANLTVDTSWYMRYRSNGNPDFGDVNSQIVNIVNRPTIPTSNNIRSRQMQAIAHSAAFHFAAIEQGGGSLYNSLLTKVTNLDVVAILASIGPTEVYHFAAFHKSLEGIFGLKTRDGLEFPNLKGNRELAEAIFPEPCKFLRPEFPLTSVIRPRNTNTAGAVAAATGLVKSGLFTGQPQAFFDAVVALATAADAAVRG
jgi:hypothetical protein